MINNQAPTIAFDVYGTLIDPLGVVDALKEYGDDIVSMFAEVLRSKQLEYSFRRALMRQYKDFDVCTRQALDYTSDLLALDLSKCKKEKLLAQYRCLPAYSDVPFALDRMRASGATMYTLTNGRLESVEQLLHNSGIRHFFVETVSVDEIESFKPDPDVYRHFLKRAKSTPESTWLVSGNPFDVVGAAAVGLRAVWIKRNPKSIFDPWEWSPNTTISTLEALPAVIEPTERNEAE